MNAINFKINQTGLAALLFIAALVDGFLLMHFVFSPVVMLGSIAAGLLTWAALKGRRNRDLLGALAGAAYMLGASACLGWTAWTQPAAMCPLV